MSTESTATPPPDSDAEPDRITRLEVCVDGLGRRVRGLADRVEERAGLHTLFDILDDIPGPAWLYLGLIVGVLYGAARARE
ncbi:MAG TPA: hypothetical protein VFA39_18955 [Steroidobacteraceae bacterium]|nr:hypothetical protein [Steroidobacteraceae bacterium]